MNMKIRFPLLVLCVEIHNLGPDPGDVPVPTAVALKSAPVKNVENRIRVFPDDSDVYPRIR